MSQYPPTTPNDSPLDWIYMRRDVEPSSLYAPLHDGVVLPSSSFAFDTRTLMLHVRVPHVAAHHDLPPEHAWRLALGDVSSLRIAFFRDQPGPNNDGKPNGVEVTVSWDELRSRITSGRADVYEADVVVASGGAALHLELGLDKPYTYCQLWARGAALAIEDASGSELSIDAFVALGTAYWEAWAARNKLK